MSVTRNPGKLDKKFIGNQVKQTRKFKSVGNIFAEDRKLNREIETRYLKS